MFCYSELTKCVNGTVLVISPIQTLMLYQVVKLDRLGIRSTLVGECQKDKGIATKIMEGEFSIVFSSPEAALTPLISRGVIYILLVNVHMHLYTRCKLQ
jgi:superfamily II DNA helicase RecQ